MSLRTIQGYIFSYVYAITTGCLLLVATAQSINELELRADILHTSFENPYKYLYAYDDNIVLRLYIDDPTHSNVVKISDEEDQNVYCLYTRENPLTEEILIHNETKSVDTSNFNSSKVTVFIIHGWVANRNSKLNTLLTEAFLQDDDVNVIVVDWGVIAKANYFTAALSLRSVGNHLGAFINWLITLGMSYEKVHVVGHSLGAHVAGVAGRKTEARVKRITALDPAGPLWAVLSYRLVRTDAQYVEVIHTNTKCLGYHGLCGDADFFPNGGERMPDCFISACSHSKSFYYMAETIINNSMYARQCSSMVEVDSNSCKGELYLMGNSDLTKNRSGIFRVETENDNQVPLLMAPVSRRFLHSETMVECEMMNDMS